MPSTGKKLDLITAARFGAVGPGHAHFDAVDFRVVDDPVNHEKSFVRFFLGENVPNFLASDVIRSSTNPARNVRLG